LEILEERENDISRELLKLTKYTRLIKKGYELRDFSMERDAEKHINLEILDLHHVIDLTQILNLLALLLSIILCLLLFQAI
jgi:hypothetical protein